VQGQRGKFYEAQMKRGESVKEFAERLRELACGLPESIDEHTAMFDCGPARLPEVPMATASTEFVTAVALLDLVMEALSISAKRGPTASENQ
jgi:ferritin-like protein